MRRKLFSLAAAVSAVMLGVAVVFTGLGCVGPRPRSPVPREMAAMVGTWKLALAVGPRGERPVIIDRPSDFCIRFYPDGTAAAWPMAGGGVRRWVFAPTPSPVTTPAPTTAPAESPVKGFLLLPDDGDDVFRILSTDGSRTEFHRVRPDLELDERRG